MVQVGWELAGLAALLVAFVVVTLVAAPSAAASDVVALPVPSISRRTVGLSCLLFVLLLRVVLASGESALELVAGLAGQAARALLGAGLAAS